MRDGGWLVKLSPVFHSCISMILRFASKLRFMFASDVFFYFLEHIKVACCLLSGIILVNIYEHFPIVSHQLVERQYIQLHSSAAGEPSDLSDLGGWELAAAYSKVPKAASKKAHQSTGISRSKTTRCSLVHSDSVFRVSRVLFQLHRLTADKDFEKS